MGSGKVTYNKVGTRLEGCRRVARRVERDAAWSVLQVQRRAAEESRRGQITGGLLINHTEQVLLCAAGDSKHEVLYRRVARRDLPFRNISLAAATEGG